MTKPITIFLLVLSLTAGPVRAENKRTILGTMATVCVVAVVLSMPFVRERWTMNQMVREINRQAAEGRFASLYASEYMKMSAADQDLALKFTFKWYHAEYLRFDETRKRFYQSVTELAARHPEILAEARRLKISLASPEEFIRAFGREEGKGSVRYYLDSSAEEWESRERLNVFGVFMLRIKIREWSENFQSGQLTAKEQKFTLGGIFRHWTGFSWYPSW